LSDSVFYFAYGSNADPERFRARVGAWRSRRPAWLADHRLRFAASVQSEGGGGAVFDERQASELAGVLYEISREQLEALDRIEQGPGRNPRKAGGRCSVTVSTAEGQRRAEVYNVRDDGGRRAPSRRYLAHILRGLRAAGHPDDVLDRVREIAEEAGAPPAQPPAGTMF